MLPAATKLAAENLPPFFCWTKFGVEAGEPVGDIRARKERERRQNDGVFLWGIGNSIRPSLHRLLSLCQEPDILFTPMLAAPGTSDVNPSKVVSWHTAIGMDGSKFAIPSTCRVTSRAANELTRLPRHYALVCRSEKCLEDDIDGLSFDNYSLRNLTSGSCVGSSQVTSVVKWVSGEPCHGGRYKVAFRASLVYPYLVTLESPRVITAGIEMAQAIAPDQHDTISALPAVTSFVRPTEQTLF